MSRRFDISHRTVYGYSQPVSLSHHLLHLAPRPHPRQITTRSILSVTPTPDMTRNGADFFRNPTTFISLMTSHRELAIHARSVVEVRPPLPLMPENTMTAGALAGHLAEAREGEALEAVQFLFASSFTREPPGLRAFAGASIDAETPVLAGALDLTRRIFEDFDYDPTATTVSTPLADVMGHRRGVCQDFAHLEIACLRALGIPARYVSGYLLTEPPEGQEKLIGADATHAWLQVYCGPEGWVDLDPTNNVIPGDEHITLAWGRDYGDVSPVNGAILGGGAHSVDVYVDVVPLPVPEEGQGSRSKT